jgi:predicted ribosome quality control (RQC) complex YloA/Tae2 family protein
MASIDREEQIRNLHEERKRKTKEKVENAIKRLTKDSKAINFNSVAKEAGVTKATLYNHSDIRERIEFLRDQQKKAYSNARVKRDEANQDAMIASLRRRIKKLEGRIEELEDENKKLRKTESTGLADYIKNL